MKKSLLFLPLLICQLYSFGQDTLLHKRYAFSHYTNQPYQSVETSGTLASLSANWDDTTTSVITLPFTFYYQNAAIDSVSIHSNGSLILNNQKFGYLDEGQIFGIRLDYESKSRAKIYHTIDGTSPNRIFKVEFKDLGLLDDASGIDSISFQIWLKEVDSSIEFHVGPHNILNSKIAKTAQEFAFQGKFAPFLGLINNAGDSLQTDFEKVYFDYVTDNNGTFTDSLIKMIKLVEDFTATTYVNSSLKRMPAPGEVFRFHPDATLSVQNIDNQIKISVFPNPTADVITFTNLKGSVLYTVYDLKGSKVLGGETNSNSIDITKLAKGMYHLTLQDTFTTYYSKIEKL